MRRVLVLSVSLSLLLVQVVWAEIPRTISYQGVLVDTSGAVVSDGSYDLTFALYDTDGGGTALWSETQSLAVSDGVFSVILGSVEVLDLAFDAAYWLGIAVDGGMELTPRMELTSLAYAIHAVRAGTADSLNGGSAEVYMNIESINGLHGDVSGGISIQAGSNVSITAENDTITISASATSGALPSGVIVMWSGSIDSIPEGWTLCDGTNGTPDLRNRFIVGIGDEYAQGDIGGEKEHLLTIDEMPSHNHTIWHDGGIAYVEWAHHRETNRGGPTETSYSGGNQPHENRPPYYALAYIMKL